MGKRRIGLALGAPSRTLTLPLDVLQRTSPRADLDQLLARIDGDAVGVVVVGIPVREDGSEGRIAKDARFLGSKLSELRPQLHVDYLDEAYTTVEAEERLRERGLDARAQRPIIDSVAAQVLLEGWLARAAADPGARGPSASD